MTSQKTKYMLLGNHPDELFCEISEQLEKLENFQQLKQRPEIC